MLYIFSKLQEIAVCKREWIKLVIINVNKNIINKSKCKFNK